MIANASSVPLARLCTAAAAVRLVKAGQNVFIGTATPQTLLAALENRQTELPEVELISFITNDLFRYYPAPRSAFRHRAFFVGRDLRSLSESGQVEYVPISLAEVPRLFANRRIDLDVALIQVSPPDARGYVSLGISVDVTAAAVQAAAVVIAEINPAMPRTHGDTFIHVNRIDRLVNVDEALPEYRHEPSDEVAKQIARYIAGVIQDGSTLQIGLGRIPNEALKYLLDRKDLGIHSDVITDGLVDLIESGVITGRRKTYMRDRIVTSWCFGSRRLYDFVGDNPLFAFLPIDHVCDPGIIEENANMVSITQAFAIDLTGQVCVDQYEGVFYGGVSTQPDFIRGAARSPGGKPIICLASSSDDNRESRVRARLKISEGVGIARSDVHYVITEFGIAYLFGKSISERTLSLIEVAHPDFREALLEEAKALGYIGAEQYIASRAPYRIEEERRVTLKNGAEVLVRPARASDAQGLQSLCVKMTTEDIYSRFFRRLRTLSYREAQSFCNVNQETSVAFVAVRGPREHEEIVGSSCYFLNPATNFAEVAYMVLPDWQGTGVGSALYERMRDYAQRGGVLGFIAEILAANVRMLRLANRTTDDVAIHRDEEIVHVTATFRREIRG